jgi:hypothetical protein
MLLNFENELGVFSEELVVHLEGIVDFRQLVGGREVNVNDGADDLNDSSLVTHGGKVVRLMWFV